MQSPSHLLSRHLRALHLLLLPLRSSTPQRPLGMPTHIQRLCNKRPRAETPQSLQPWPMSRHRDNKSQIISTRTCPRRGRRCTGWMASLFQRLNIKSPRAGLIPRQRDQQTHITISTMTCTHHIRRSTCPHYPLLVQERRALRTYEAPLPTILGPPADPAVLSRPFVFLVHGGPLRKMKTPLGVPNLIPWLTHRVHRPLMSTIYSPPLHQSGLNGLP